MSVAIVTGSGGLVGSEAVRYLTRKGLDVVGIDNDSRAAFFGREATTRPMWTALQGELNSYTHLEADIRDASAIDQLFARYKNQIALVIHSAAQPSHDWAAREPLTDFSVNAVGTVNLLEATRQHAPDAVFVFCSTNKVYGDQPNRLPFVEEPSRWRVADSHPFAAHGIDETMSLDRCLHSLFGASKCSADLMVQEYGRYFGMRTACFRAGCITGPGHAGVQLHGFLSYLVKCAVSGVEYKVIGYKGKQVRDNIHSFDLVNAFWHFFEKPRVAETYNMGGGTEANCSVLEAIALSERLVGRAMKHSYTDENRTGDHIWWISDLRRFQGHYPDWKLTRSIEGVICEIRDAFIDRGVVS
jgi:CDP-paratose 2-epimerase